MSTEMTGMTMANNSIAGSKVDQINFLYGLRLVTKEQFLEMKTRKSGRKRRTTANPQFTNAAIEAKRITALEKAAKKAKRRSLITEGGGGGSLAAQRESRRTSTASSVAQRNASSRTTSPAMMVNNDHVIKEEIGTRKELKDGRPRLNHVIMVTSTSDLPVSSTNNCHVCCESCDYIGEVILFCRNCHTLFHGTCTTVSLHDVARNQFVPCPKCDSKEQSTTKKSGLGSSILLKPSHGTSNNLNYLTSNNSNMRSGSMNGSPTIDSELVHKKMEEIEKLTTTKQSLIDERETLRKKRRSDHKAYEVGIGSVILL